MSKIKDILNNVDKDDVTFVIEIGSELIKAGSDILDTLKNKRDFSMSELIELANDSVTRRNIAEQKLNEHIKERISKLENSN